MTVLPLSPSEGRLTGNLMGMASMIIWATGFPAVDRLLPDLGAVPLTAARMTLAVLLLLPMWAMLDGWRAMARAPWVRGLWIGALGFGFGAFLLVVAQQMTDAVTVAIITSAMPVIGITIECLFDGRRLTPLLVVGLILSLLGGTLAYLARFSDFGLGFGALFAFLSVLMFTWGSRQTVRGLGDMSPVGRTALTFAGGAAATLAAALAQAALGKSVAQPAALDTFDLLLLVYYGCGSLAISQVLWIASVERLGIGIAAMHINAAPFYVMILVWMLGGSFVWGQLAGAVLVLAGVLLAQRPSVRQG